MELDELKNSWNLLDKQLQKDPITNNKQVMKLIAQYKANANKSLRSLTGWQRFSIAIGLVGIFILLAIWLLPSVFHISEEYQTKINTLIIFIGASILGGMYWDCKNYIWIKNTKIDEMPVAVVSKRVLRFSQWMKYEVIAISAWTVLFNIMYYWTMSFYKKTFNVQIILISAMVLFDIAIIYLLYKKVAYKHLNNIKRNIEELRDISTK